MGTRDEKRIRSIAARATPLWDREWAADQTLAADKATLQKRLERWKKVLGRIAFDRRLRDINFPFSRAAVDSLLGEEARILQGPLPSWASTLEQILITHSSSCDIDELERVGDRSSAQTPALPFEDILVGFLQYARAQLKSRAGPCVQVLAPRAVSTLERQLLSHLTFLAGLTFGSDFYEFRFKRAPLSAFETIWSQQQPSRKIYSTYVRHMQNGGLLELLDRHPVLARLLAQSVEQWINASVNLCQRFFKDFCDLRTFFDWKVDRPEGAVAELRTNLSDRHQGGERVAECVLSTSQRVIYKPRTVQTELAFNRILTWINSCGMSLQLRELQVLDRTTHGWVGSVPCLPCATNEEVERFYSRAGMLLAILYLLSATDIHYENLIASGEHPVIVDLETLLSGQVRSVSMNQQDDSVDDPMLAEPSVLGIGLLPRWQTAPEGQEFDMSGLGADETQDPGKGHWSWQSVNTDQMMLSERTSMKLSSAHRVRFGNALPSALDKLPMFLAGFKEVYSCFLSNKKRLLDDVALMNVFDNLELRILLRNTMTYARLQLRLLHPKFLKDGVDRSIELDWLARPLCRPVSPAKHHLQIYEWERKAMEDFDIPHFGTSAWRHLEDLPEEAELASLFRKRDSSMIKRRLAILGPDDCSRQLAIIENTLRSRFS